jgi:serine-type D-Ala-D-Ala carboxypeptidase/endopeptidase (penicillin-binding protein 4)
VPDPESRLVRVYAIPALAGMTVPSQVRADEGPCNDWRARLGGDFSDPLRPQFRGGYPLSCGERIWHVSLLTATAYGEALFRSLWEASGGVWRGRARDGLAPPDARRLAQHESRALSEVIRDINKFSNNVMARQLFLAIGAEVSRAPASAERTRKVLEDWLVGKGLDRREFALENGAGLSRIERLTAAGLVRLLAAAYASPLMPEFVSSLPLVGVDGTMRRRAAAAGSAHIKTGLLTDTRAIAGYVLAASGRRYAVAAIINHTNAGAAAGALDELLNWIHSNG